MSLLRRMPPRLRADDENENEDQPERPSPPPRLALTRLWHHTADGKLFTIAMTRDSRFIIAGSQAGEVLFFDIAGRLLWKGKVRGAVNRLALADDAECFVVGTLASDHNAYLWHYSGRLLRTFPTGGGTWAVGATPDASLIAVGSLDKHLYGFDRHGEQLFKRPVNAAIRHVTITADGALILAGSDDHHLYAFDHAGNERWQYQTGGPVWAGVRIAEQGRVLVAASNDGCVYGLDFDGQERWKYDTGGKVNTLVVTPDGNLCAAAGQSNTAYLLNSEGNVLWEYQAQDHIYGLDLTPDGRFLLIGSNDNNVYLSDHQNGRRVWQEPTNGRVYGVAQTPNGQFFAAASTDQNVYAFKNTLVPDDPQALTRPASPVLMRLVVQRVREEYAVAPHAGLVRWFGEFERSLRNQQFDACDALLNEVHTDGGIGLSEGEKQYTRSLEGVCWLFRGAAHHRHGQYVEARACYERSKAIQESLNNQDGAGQVVAALSLLPPDETPTEAGEEVAALVPPTDEQLALLNEITEKPRVLGMSEKLLAQRLAAVPPAEQLQIILLSRLSGYIAPLLKALNADERVIRAAAGAALALLDPGPDHDVLAQMLTSSQSFVQWQALRILRDRATNHADQFGEAKTRLWPLVMSNNSPDPLTRREAALLVREAGDAADTPWLINRLNDVDSDVQLAVIDALGAVGDRSALAHLGRARQRGGFLGRDLGMAAGEARSAIENRYPLPSVEQIVFCQADPLQQSVVQQSSLFMADAGTVYGIVTVDHVPPNTPVTIKWLSGDTVLGEEQRVIDDQPGPRLADVQEIEIVDDQAGLGAGGLRRPGRSPFGGSPFRSRAPFGQDEEDESDQPGPPRRASPFDRRPEPAPAPPSGGLRGRFGRGEPPPPPPRPSSPFERRPVPEAPSRPTLGRPQPLAPAPRSGDRAPGGTARPGGFGGDRPRFGAEPPGRTAAPSRFGERPGFLRDRDSNQEPEAEPSNQPRRDTDPNENVDPADHAPAANAPGGLPPASPFRSRAPLGDRPGGFRPSRPQPADSSPAADLPDWLRPIDEGDPDPGRPGLFGRPAPSLFSRPGQPAEPRRSPFSRGPRPGASATSQRLAFALPRPENGWETTPYQLEVVIGSTAKQTAPFRFIEAIRLTALEPGAIGQRPDDFGRTATFLVGTQYVDCMAHLEAAPVNTTITGRLYHATTGTLLAQTSAQTPKQGRQSVTLSWENTGWQPGDYRLVVAVERGNELTTAVQLVSRIRAEQIILCHQVDKNNQPVGANWPFYPGDHCCCVVELGTPPVGVEVVASWYRKNETAPMYQTRPYTTTASPDQRVIFRLVPGGKPAALTPGHYSVVIAGRNLTREERAFEVLPYSRGQNIKRALQNVYQRIAPLIERYHLLVALAALGLTALLVLAFWLADAGLKETFGATQRSREALLLIGHSLGHARPEWGLGWLAFGSVYAALRVRYVKKLGSDTESLLYEAINLLLVFASSVLAWYLASYLAFGAGHLWPNALAGFFAKLLWLAPIVAWFGPVVSVVLVEWQRQDNSEDPFYLGPVRAVIGVIGTMLAGWAGALGIGLLVGLIGVVIGSLLNAVGLDNRLGHAFMTVGAGAGFFLGLIAATVYAVHDDVESLWQDWRQKKRQEGANYHALRFLMEEEIVPNHPREVALAARLSLRALIFMGAAMLALWVALDPVIVPALRWLYSAPDKDAFARAITSSPLATVSTIAVLLVYPALVIEIHRLFISPRLNASDAAFLRRYYWFAAALVITVPVTIFIAGRSIMGSDLEAEVNIFWTGRAAAIVFFAGLAAVLAHMIWKMPEPLRSTLDLDFSTGEIVVIVIALLAAALLPGWMWALLFGVTLSIISSVYVLQRV